MATLADLQSQVSAAVLALPGGTKSRLASDYSETVPVPVGEIGVQIRASLLNVVFPDSATIAEAARVEVVMVRRLSIAASEQAYAAGQMVADMSAMLAHGFWTGLPAVHSFVDGDEPGVSVQPELRGSVFLYSVISDVVLATA